MHIQAEGSALAARFSGNWEQCLDHDDQGRIFLDFDPELFKHILLYLRTRMLSSPDDIILLPQFDGHKQQAFNKLIRYLALEEYMGCADRTAPLAQTVAARADGSGRAQLCALDAIPSAQMVQRE